MGCRTFPFGQVRCDALCRNSLPRSLVVSTPYGTEPLSYFSPEVEAFYRDHITVPSLLKLETYVRRSFDKALQRPLEYLERAKAVNKVALEVRQENLLGLLSLKGNLHAAVGALRFLSE